LFQQKHSLERETSVEQKESQYEHGGSRANARSVKKNSGQFQGNSNQSLLFLSTLGDLWSSLVRNVDLSLVKNAGITFLLTEVSMQYSASTQRS